MAIEFVPSSPLDVMTGTLQVVASFSYTPPLAAVKAVVSSSKTIPQPAAFDCVTQTPSSYKITGGVGRTFTRYFSLTPTAYGYQQGSGNITLGIRLSFYDSNGNEIRSTRDEEEFQVLSIQHPAPTLGITSIERSNYSGQTADGGSYGRIGLNAVFSGSIEEAQALVDGTVTPASWYKEYTEGAGCSDLISDWSTVNSGDTVYCIVAASAAATHTIQLIVKDSFNQASSVSGNIAKGDAYPLNFAAGGDGVGFGVKAESGKFRCALDSIFSGALKQKQVRSGQTVDVPVALEGHTHNMSDITWLDTVYPVGSVVTVGCTSIGTPLYNPATRLGGSWTKIEEYLARKVIQEDEQLTTSSYWTRNTTNCTSARIEAVVQDYQLNLSIYFYNKVKITDSTLEIMTLNLSALGIAGDLPQAYPVAGWTDGAEGVVMCKLGITGVLNTVDYVAKASGTGNTHNHATLATGSAVQLHIPITLTYNDVLTSKCDRFLYRRTA